MYLSILIYIFATSIVIRSLFRTFSVIKAVFKNEKTSVRPSLNVSDILQL